MPNVSQIHHEKRMSRAAAGQGRKKKHQPTRERIKFFFFS
jgi:hypothetical protein